MFPVSLRGGARLKDYTAITQVGKNRNAHEASMWLKSPDEPTYQVLLAWPRSALRVQYQFISPSGVIFTLFFSLPKNTYPPFTSSTDGKKNVSIVSSVCVLLNSAMFILPSHTSHNQISVCICSHFHWLFLFFVVPDRPYFRRYGISPI